MDKENLKCVTTLLVHVDKVDKANSKKEKLLKVLMIKNNQNSYLELQGCLERLQFINFF